MELLVYFLQQIRQCPIFQLLKFFLCSDVCQLCSHFIFFKLMGKSSSTHIPLYDSFISACSPNHTNVSAIIAPAIVKSKNYHLCMDSQNTQNQRMQFFLYFLLALGQFHFYLFLNEIIVNISVHISVQTQRFFYAGKTLNWLLLLRTKAPYLFSF